MPDGGDRPPVDAETALSGTAPGHKDELRLWLRLLSTARLVEAELRRRLRLRFATTLPRFDLMAQLHRAGPAGLTAGEVSRRMMVTGGNVTGLAARLEEEGLVERAPLPGDRRSAVLRLTVLGRREFARQSAAHEAWVAELLDGLRRGERRELLRLLDAARGSVRSALREFEREERAMSEAEAA